MSPGTRWKHCAAHFSAAWTSQLISQWEDEEGNIKQTAKNAKNLGAKLNLKQQQI